MSVPERSAERPADTVAGFMATASLFANLVAVVYRPVRIAPAAILVAVIAAGMGGRHARLAAFAVAVGTACFAAGMTIAVLTEHPLY